jgi:hypothetical protein
MASPMLQSIPSPNPSQPTAEPLAGSDGRSEPRVDKPLQTGTIGICGAMSLQGGDSGRATNRCRKNLYTWFAAAIPKFGPSQGPAAAGPDKQ